MYQTISSHVAKFSVYVRFLKLQCDKHHDIIDAVTGTINTTSTAAGGATAATSSANVVTTSQASAATTNPGMSLCYYFDTISFVNCLDETRPLIASLKTLPNYINNLIRPA